MKIVSWNVNGIRAVQKKGFADILQQIDADCLLLQETKAQADQIETALAEIDGYHIYSNCAERKGYSGVSILSRREPLNINADIGVVEHDREGRVIAAEFDSFFLVDVYVPNAGEELARLDYRQTWDREFLDYLAALQARKPVIVGGDFNVAHREIDIARPKANYNKSAGYTQVEIDGFSRFIQAGFVDTYRYFHPDSVAYSWWSFRANARANNIGWRIDYLLVSGSFIGKVRKAFILSEVFGSDHCPVGIEIDG